MGYAHCLTERNIWEKFNENRTMGSGDIEQAPNPRVNPLNTWVKFKENRQRVPEIWRGHKIQG